MSNYKYINPHISPIKNSARIRRPFFGGGEWLAQGKKTNLAGFNSVYFSQQPK